MLVLAKPMQFVREAVCFVRYRFISVVGMGVPCTYIQTCNRALDLSDTEECVLCLLEAGVVGKKSEISHLTC